MEYPTAGTYEYTAINATAMTISSTVSTEVFAANAERVGVRIINNGPYLAYLGIGEDASKTKGIKLIRDASWEMTREKLFRGTINAISNTASAAKGLVVRDEYIVS